MAFKGPQDGADGLDPERTINYSVYCGQCGFNLRYSTHVGRCNECGNPYNARPLVLKGVFNPHEHRIPLMDSFLTLVCLGGAFLLIRGSIYPPVASKLFIGGFLGLTGLIHFVLAATRLSRFIRFQRILFRIESEEED